MRPCTSSVRRGVLSGCVLYLRLRVENNTDDELKLFSNPSTNKTQSADACSLLALFQVRMRVQSKRTYMFTTNPDLLCNIADVVPCRADRRLVYCHVT